MRLFERGRLPLFGFDLLDDVRLSFSVALLAEVEVPSVHSEERLLAEFLLGDVAPAK